MAQIIIIVIIVLFFLWSISFFVLWFQSIHLAKMIDTLEQAVDYSLLKTDLYTILLKEGEEGIEKKESEIRSKMDEMKYKIRKDFDV